MVGWTYLVTFTNFSDNILLWDLDIVESELTSGRGLDTELSISVIFTWGQKPTLDSFFVISTPISLLMTKQVIPL